MVAISDSSPLILYSRVQRLDLLRALFGEILIPPTVRQEVIAAGANRVGAAEVQQATWIRPAPLPMQGVPERFAVLDPGEAEAITIASSFGFSGPVLIDDLQARKLARTAGLFVVGSGGILLLAKDAGLIRSIRPLLSALRSEGLYLSQAVAVDLLRAAGEPINPAAF